MIYEEATGTLLCGDLFTRTGNGAALVHDADLVEPGAGGRRPLRGHRV